MNTFDIRVWSGRRWVQVVTFIFGLQLLCVIALSSRKPLVIRSESVHTHWKMANSSVSTHTDSTSRLSDPWVFTSVHPSGFSGLAWLQRRLPSYNISIGDNSTDFMDSQEIVPVNPFIPYSLAGSLPGELKLDLPPPPPAVSLPSTEIPNRTSRWFLSGDISIRTPLTKINLPTQQGGDILSNSVVQIAVLPSGATSIARIWQTSGSRGVDLQALHVAQNLRFSSQHDPLSSPNNQSLTWGWIHFQWFTGELSTLHTNSSTTL